jgi:hypothetical protein
MRDVLLLLMDLEAQFPPGEGQRHAITLDDKHLRITLFLGARVASYTLDEDDLDRTVFEIARDLALLHAARPA